MKLVLTQMTFAVSIFLVAIKLSLSLRWSSNQLFDLEGSGSSFISETNLWSATELASPGVKHYDCGGVYLLGGFGILGQVGAGYTSGQYFARTYTSLPSHNMIIVSLTFYKIDSWDVGEQDHANFMFDSVLLTSWSLPSFQPYEQPLCGSPIFNEYPNIRIRMYIPHKGSTLVMKVISTLNQDSTDESFGIRDINMIFLNSPIPQQAILCGVSSSALPDRECPCDFSNEFENTPGSSSCSLCHNNCPICNGPTANNCLACSVNKYMNSNNECVDCSSPCATCEGNSTHCVTCISGHFLVENKTCIPQCSPPLIQTSDGFNKFCESPCVSTQFLYPNRSCSIACDALLDEETIINFKLCKFPCPTSQFLYYNGTCSPSCNLPFSLRSYGSYDVCDYICSKTEYLYPNGTCKDVCKSPYKPVLRGKYRFCEPICDPLKYFLFKNLTCAPICPDYFYSEENPKTCNACKDSFCLKCPRSSGQICQECEKNTILDIDGTCKICNALEIDYMKSINSNEHQYRLDLSPLSCHLDLEIIKNNLIGLTSSDTVFPLYSLTFKRLGDTSYVFSIIFGGSVLKPSNLDFKLYHLNGTAPVPKTYIPSSGVQKLAEYGPAAQTAMTAITASTMGGALALGATAVLWSMINFQQFVGYFIYINVDYPLQVELFLSLFTFSSFNFLPNPIAPITDQLAKDILKDNDDDLLKTHETPRKFRKYDQTSFFVENGAPALLNNLGFLLILAITDLFTKYYRRKQLPFVKMIHHSFKWNFIMRSFLENGIPLSLATFLQIRKLSFENNYMKICGFLAILSFFYLISMTHFLFNSLVRRSCTRLKNKHVAKIYGTLYEGINVDTKIGKYYHLFILLRGILLIFLVAFLEISPLLQILPLILVNIGLIFFLFKEDVFENSNLNKINRAKEILIVLAEISIMLLNFESRSESYSQTLGWIIIICLGTVVLIELVYMVIIQIMSLKLIFAKVKAKYQFLRMEYFNSRKIRKVGVEER